MRRRAALRASQLLSRGFHEASASRGNNEASAPATHSRGKQQKRIGRFCLEVYRLMSPFLYILCNVTIMWTMFFFSRISCNRELHWARLTDKCYVPLLSKNRNISSCILHNCTGGLSCTVAHFVSDDWISDLRNKGKRKWTKSAKETDVPHLIGLCIPHSKLTHRS